MSRLSGSVGARCCRARGSARTNEARLEACKKRVEEWNYCSHDTCDLHDLPAYNNPPNRVEQIRVRREGLNVYDLYDRGHDDTIISISIYLDTI